MNRLLIAFLFFGLIASITVSMKIDVRPQSEPNLQDIPLCLICDFAVGRIEKYLDDKANNTVIIDKVEKDCRILRNSWVGKCKNIVAEYGPKIIDLLESNQSPKAVCALIELC
ncbi:hypothetical protein ACTA71_010840 [Dictyostelium dimigraforme]